MNLELAELCIYIYDTGDLSNGDGDILCIYIYILYTYYIIWTTHGKQMVRMIEWCFNGNQLVIVIVINSSLRSLINGVNSIYLMAE